MALTVQEQLTDLVVLHGHCHSLILTSVRSWSGLKCQISCVNFLPMLSS